MKHTQKIFWTITVGFSILFQSGCKDNNDNSNPKSSTSRIYIAGFEYESSESIALWNNISGTTFRTILNSDMSTNGEAFSVYVEGNDVYVAGYEQADGEKGVTGGNVARLLFWPSIVGTYLNANEAIQAADSRTVHLANIMRNKNCEVPK